MSDIVIPDDSWATLPLVQREAVLSDLAADFARDRTKGYVRAPGAVHAPAQSATGEELFLEFEAFASRRIRAEFGSDARLLYPEDGHGWSDLTPDAAAWYRRWSATISTAVARAAAEHSRQHETDRAAEAAANPGHPFVPGSLAPLTGTPPAERVSAEAWLAAQPHPPEPPPVAAAPAEPVPVAQAQADPSRDEWFAMTSEDRAEVARRWTAEWARDRARGVIPSSDPLRGETIPVDVVADWEHHLQQRFVAVYGPGAPENILPLLGEAVAEEWRMEAIRQFNDAAKGNPRRPEIEPEAGHIPGASRRAPGPTAAEWHAQHIAEIAARHRTPAEWLRDQERQRQARAQARADEAERIRLSRIARGRAPGSF